MNRVEKITFHRLDADFRPLAGSEVTAQFNPTELSWSKAAQIAEIAIPGLDTPILQWVRGQNETLSLELLFDTTESGTAGDEVEPVTARTDRFFQLIKIDRATHAPPILHVTWGFNELPGAFFDSPWASQSRFAFQCVVESIEQKMTLFSPDGVPLRATLSVKLREYKTLCQQVEEIRFESPDHTHSRVVRRGETLSRLAGEAYGDPSRWRAIAEHNGIDDPLELEEGRVLEIPPIV